MILCLVILTVGASGATGAIGSSDAERSLLQRLESREYIKARAEAETLLSAEPDSVVAMWGLAVVHEMGEGNAARAIYYLKRAEARAEGDWLRRILEREYVVLMDMNENAESLQVLDRHDALFPPIDPTYRIWPLFKVGRVAEAFAIGTAATSSKDWDTRAKAFNGLMSLTFEQRDREGTYQWTLQAIERLQGRSCVIFRNGAGAAFNHFRLDQAEEFALRAAKAEVQDCAGSKGYDQLSGIYMLEGEFQKALSALRSLNHEHLEPWQRPQYAMTRRAILALILGLLGKVQDAERLSAELFTIPQRMGMNSSAEADERLMRTFHYWAALDTRLIEERERQSYQSFFSSPSFAWVPLGWTRWQLRRALVQLLAQGDTLVQRARPNSFDPFDWPAFFIADLSRIVGTGVLSKALLNARALDASSPDSSAYYDAISGEVAFRRGRLQDAIVLADDALSRLNRQEGLLRWRTLAWQADALRRVGRVQDARAPMREVLANLPSVLRVLDVAVPVYVSDDGTSLAHEAAVRLARSSRFFVDASAALHLFASSHADGVEICLRDDAGMQLSCATGKTADDSLIAFHSACFSPKVSLSQVDLNSLDGSPVRATADEALEGALNP